MVPRDDEIFLHSASACLFSDRGPPTFPSAIFSPIFPILGLGWDMFGYVVGSRIT